MRQNRKWNKDESNITKRYLTTFKYSAIVFKQDTKFNMMLKKIKESLIFWMSELPG